MSADPVIPTACTLDVASAKARVARWSALAAAAQVEAESVPGLLRVRYRASTDTATEVRALAELERECCAFLDYRVEEDQGAVTLTVTAASGADPGVAAELETLAGVVVR